MRVVKVALVLCCSLMLTACIAPLIAGAQSQLLWALIKPMVGLDPNEVNLFEQPLIKDRMQPLLGEHYGTAVSLLKTADEIQQEGPLFYVLSNNALTQPLADKAGFVWNSQSNQMAILLQQQGKQQIFSEPLAAGSTAVANASSAAGLTWPSQMQPLLQLQQQASQAAASQVEQGVSNSTQTLSDAASAAVDTQH